MFIKMRWQEIVLRASEYLLTRCEWFLQKEEIRLKLAMPKIISCEANKPGGHFHTNHWRDMPFFRVSIFSLMYQPIPRITIPPPGNPGAFDQIFARGIWPKNQLIANAN